MTPSSSAAWCRTSSPATPTLEVVGTAANGRIALAKMTQVNPDLVILDVEMPEMDGLATLKELRKTYPRLPVIMFSALTERGRPRRSTPWPSGRPTTSPNPPTRAAWTPRCRSSGSN